MSAAKFRLGWDRTLLIAARGNILPIIAVASFLFSAVLAATYEQGLLDQSAVLQPSAIQAQRGNAYLAPSMGLLGVPFFLSSFIPKTPWHGLMAPH